MKWLLFLAVLLTADWIVLDYMENLNQKYYVLLHGSLVFLALIIALIIGLVRARTPDYLGYGITAGLLIKMIFMALLFLFMHQKMNLTNGEIINFLVVYAVYTVLIIFYAVSRLKFDK